MHAPPLSSDLVSSWAVVNGLRIHARVSTSSSPAALPAAVPIVLVHGLGVSGTYMLPTAELLAAGHAVFVPDLPGFGRSEKPALVLGVSELADALADWLPAIGLSRAAFLGNSLGCQVIVDLAVRYPERISHAVLVSPTVDCVGRTLPRQLMRGACDLWLEPWSLWPILAHDYYVTGNRRLYRTLCRALGDPVERKFAEMRVPTLVVRGERDPIVPQRWAEEIVRLLPHGELAVIAGAAHAANFSAPQALTQLVEQFLQNAVLRDARNHHPLHSPP